jgi:SAM-dependent methyltransferase
VGGRSDRVLVLGIPDWGATRFGAASGRDQAQVSRELDAYNAVAQSICRANDVAFIDVAATSRAKGLDDAMLTDDGLHPSAAMYGEWVELALPVVRGLLAGAGVSADTRPFEPDTAKRIAGAFRPPSLFGNRYDYYYSLAKLRSDPLYPGVLDALRGCDAPLLDLGCGLGLLAHALREDGQSMAYRGVAVDAGKIRRARRAAMRAGLEHVGFDVADLQAGPPVHTGSIAILDVLQYLSDADQRRMLAEAAAMLAPGARLVIRTGLDDHTRRGRITRFIDRLGHWLGWMKTTPKSYPTRAGLGDRLGEAGLSARFTPLHGDTPFNNWLVVAER